VVFFPPPPRVVVVPLGARPRRFDLPPRICDRTRQVAPFDAELDPDETRAALAINECSTLTDLDIRELTERKMLVVRRGDQDVLDGLHVLAVGLQQPHHKIERSFSL